MVVEDGCEKLHLTVTFPRFPRTRDLYITRCSCSVQRSRLALLRSLGRFSAGLLGLATPPVAPPPPNSRAGRGCNFVVRAFSVNFCRKEKRQNVRPQRMFLFYISLNVGACTAWTKTKNSRSGWNYDYKQSVLQTNAKYMHTRKLCLSTCNRPSE